MTSHALTPEQEYREKKAYLDAVERIYVMFHGAALAHPKIGANGNVSSAHSVAPAIIHETLRDLARTLLEPVEKERDGAARDHHRSWPECPECLHYFREDENYAMLNAKQASELEEAREENTRLREQLDEAQELLRRIQGWDHMDDAEDGHYWRREIAAVAKPLWQMLAELGDSVPAAEWDRAAHARVASAEKELAAARAALEPRPPLRDEEKGTV